LAGFAMARNNLGLKMLGLIKNGFNLIMNVYRRVGMRQSFDRTTGLISNTGWGLLREFSNDGAELE
jgi:hypothetical protein